ncbi:helix-turn-helix transcriptional regulator [Agrobacterium vitis]|uniref:helix-turn-helix transcriptional regulator n=1 Tax=Agrobacterium vitis TaxID=373 RepID=UPI000B1BA96C|nr:AraC family transcriptional regulator [Agrobacterium vitis]WEO75410.1 AraC family transcriptional regulator [Agrobacterium vitis]
MSEWLAVSEKIAASFGVKAARALVIRPLRDAQLTVVHIQRCYEHGNSRVILEPDNAFLVMLYLEDAEHSDIVSEERLEPIKIYPKASICLVSLKQGAAISINGRLDVLAFHVPVAHLAELTEEAGEPRVDDFLTCRGLHDQVISNMGAALMPLFDMPDEVRDTLVPHIGLAFIAHLAHKYGRSPSQHLSASGQLNSMQEERIKTYINTNLSRNIGLEDISVASGFSIEELCSGFEETTGQSIGEWLLASRIARAKAYLTKTGESIDQVAETCGFRNQTSFVESFTHSVGVTPDEWRSRDRH